MCISKKVNMISYKKNKSIVHNDLLQEHKPL
jgi:hypothetical protein